MKKFIRNSIVPIIRIALFCYIFILFLTFISYISKPLDVNLESISGIYGEKNNSLDVVYIGGSAACEYYATMYAWDKYGIVSYDYGSNSIEAEIYKYLIKETLKTQKPKLIIIDSRPFQYGDATSPEHKAIHYRNTLKGMKFSLNKLNFINENIRKRTNDTDETSYYFDISMYHGNFGYTKNKLDMMFGKYKHIYNGFHSYATVEKLNQEDFKTDEITKLSETTNQILVDLLEYTKQTDVDYLFVVSPYVETKDHKKVYNYVETVVNQYGYRFLDANEYTESMKLDYSSDFRNIEHVNIFGAKKYTDFLSNYIIENYNTPNHKNDSKYNYMNDNLEIWYNEEKKMEASYGL